MRESVNVTTVELDLVNRETGETQTIVGTNTESNKYYSVRNITTRINIMDFTSALASVATTPNQMYLLGALLDSADCDNKIVIINQRKLAEQLGASTSMLKTLLKKLADSKLAIKTDTGVYVINPFIYIGKRTRSNEARESLQSYWKNVLAPKHNKKW